MEPALVALEYTFVPAPQIAKLWLVEHHWRSDHHFNLHPHHHFHNLHMRMQSQTPLLTLLDTMPLGIARHGHATDAIQRPLHVYLSFGLPMSSSPAYPHMVAADRNICSALYAGCSYRIGIPVWK